MSAPTSAQTDVEAALERTVARYRGAPKTEREIVKGKLRSDPIARDLAALDTSFGRVCDAGCGRGQVGLFLLELGRAESLVGFDADERRIRTARGAAPNEARLELLSFDGFTWPEADTILFIDSLHYVPVAAQDETLERAAGSVAAGGRIVVREVNARTGPRSLFTRALERAAAVLRRQRVEFGFRTTESLVARLRRLGLDTRVVPSRGGVPFDNQIVVASKR